MTAIVNSIWKLKIWKDTRGQDFAEYALIAAFIVLTYGAISPHVAPAVCNVFSKVQSNLTKAGG